MENLQVNTGSAAGVKQMNLVQRILGVIFSPSETMKGLAEKPRILFPILLIALGTPLFYLSRFSLYKDFLRESMEVTMAQSNMGIEMTAEQMELALKYGAIGGLVSGPFVNLVFWLFYTGLLFAICKIFKGQGNFKQYASVIGYSYVITILYYLISIGVSFFSGKLMFDASLANITNLFAPDMAGSFIYGVIRGIDLFTVWYFTVIGIGISRVSGLGKGKVYPAVFGILLLSVLIGANSMKLM